MPDENPFAFKILICRGVFFLGALVLIITGRLVFESRYHFEKAEAFHRAWGNDRAAIAQYEEAAKAYIPGGFFYRKALGKMMIMAKSAQMRGEKENALYIWEVVRRSVLATRHFVQPEQDILAEAEKNIISFREDSRKNITAQKILPPANDPSPVVSLLVFLGLALWIVGSMFTLSFLKPKNERPEASSMVLSVTAMIGGLALWITMSFMVTI